MADKDAKKNDDKRPQIFIKKVKRIEGGHHGGAWKVAYADFVTAMMAFFLLLWLLSVTTEVQKKKIADYFAPQAISSSQSGAGGVMGGTTISPDGAMTSTTTTQIDQMDNVTENDKAKNAEMDRADEKAFKEAQEELKKQIESTPELKELSQNLLIDMTPEGLRIQIVDQDGKPMFELGSAKPLPAAVKILGVVTQVIKDLPNQISIRGHTDNKPYGKDAEYTNWELSSDRSNASRRIMLRDGLNVIRIDNVQGKADHEPLVPTDPGAAKNRRISIILIKQSLVASTKRAEDRMKAGKSGATPTTPEVKKREEGIIYFP